MLAVVNVLVIVCTIYDSRFISVSHSMGSTTIHECRKLANYKF